jgi:hypothetical protein
MTKNFKFSFQVEIEERELEENMRKQFKAHKVGETLPRYGVTNTGSKSYKYRE